MRIWLAMMWGTAALAQETPKLPSDYFKLLLRFRIGAVDAEQVVRTYPYQTFDEKNGYCAEGMDHGGMGYMFAVWKKENGRVFGFSEPSRRADNLYDTTFWSYDQGRWTELKDVVPPISLEDFWPLGQPVPAELRPFAFFEMDLPRTGTTLKVRLKGICVKEACENEARVDREAAYNRMELEWQPKHGRFVKGTKSLTR